MSGRIEILLRSYEWEVIASVLRWADKKMREDDPKWGELVDPHRKLLKLACWIEDMNDVDQD